MSYDAKCYDLATEFLLDEPKLDSTIHRQVVAQAIQDAIESQFDYFRYHSIDDPLVRELQHLSGCDEMSDGSEVPDGDSH